MRLISTLTMLLGTIVACGCEKSDQPAPPAPPPPPAAAVSKEPTADKNAAGPDTGADARPGHSGAFVALGIQQAGKFSVRASRDQGEIKAGGDAPVDVWVDGGLGEGVTAVRFWIGAQDARGSVKAKAEVEDGKWHTHVEIPNPMPPETKLWVEIEHSGGPTLASFDLAS